MQTSNKENIERSCRKRMLLGYFNNFYDTSMGCNAYLLEIIKILKQQGWEIDYFSTNHLVDNFRNFQEQNEKHKLINRLFLYAPPHRLQEKDAPPSRICRAKQFIKKNLKKLRDVHPVFRYSINAAKEVFHFFFRQKMFISKFGWLTPEMIEIFKQTLKENQYDVIYFHYIQIAEVLLYVTPPEQTRLIYSAQDLNFLQFFYQRETARFPATAKQMNYELEVMSFFDDILCISFDEMLFLKKFFPHKNFFFLPHTIPQKTLPHADREIDILFIGNNNKFNFNGLKWFFLSVLPLCKQPHTIAIVGKVWDKIEQDHQFMNVMQKFSVKKIAYAPDLDVLYSQARISLAPMFEGTGMKIKTIDSMSRGIPVVSTFGGVDGFPDKTNNGCMVSDDPVIFAKNIDSILDSEAIWTNQHEQTLRYYKKHFDRENAETVIQKCFDNNKKGKR